MSQDDLKAWEEELVSQVDIVEYIGQYVDLEPKGNEYWGLSCFKVEDTPSFSVDPEKQVYYDFSSHSGGNVVSFVMKKNRVNLQGALGIIEEYLGKEAVVRPPSLSATSCIKRLFLSQKHRKTPTYEILPDDYMDQYQKEADELLVWEREGITKEAMAKFQVRFDPNCQRIVYPLRSLDGKIINIRGRSTVSDFDGKPKIGKVRKYTNLFELGVMDTLYGFYENEEAIRQQKEIILFEGEKSVMKAWGWGVRNCAAMCTSAIGPEQIKILIKLGCPVVMALDSDVDVMHSKELRTLKRFVTIHCITGTQGLLGDKMAPVDGTYEDWRKLYDQRILYRG